MSSLGQRAIPLLLSARATGATVPVKTVVDLRLCTEAAEYQLRFTLRGLRPLLASRSKRCANGYPNLTFISAHAVSPAAVFEFCKEFELR